MSWEEFKAFFCTLLYPNISIIYWYKLGKNPWETFLILCFVRTICLILTYKFFDLIFPISKKIPDKYLWQFPGYFKKLYHKFVGNLKSKLVEKFIEILAKRKYFLFFVCNTIPGVPFLPTATVAAAKLTKSQGAFWIILAGNIVKIYILVTTIYHIGSLLK